MIEKIIILSFIVIAIWSTMWEGMIFGKVHQWFDKWPEWIKKPAFLCVICMTFWYGLLASFIIWHRIEIVAIIGAMGMNAALTRIFKDS